MVATAAVRQNKGFTRDACERGVQSGEEPTKPAWVTTRCGVDLRAHLKEASSSAGGGLPGGIRKTCPMEP